MIRIFYLGILSLMFICCTSSSSFKKKIETSLDINEISRKDILGVWKLDSIYQINSDTFFSVEIEYYFFKKETLKVSNKYEFLLSDNKKKYNYYHWSLDDGNLILYYNILINDKNEKGNIKSQFIDVNIDRKTGTMTLKDIEFNNILYLSRFYP